VHAFDDPMVMAGNATIAYEIAEDLPDVAAVLTPWGGGGLSCGVAVGLGEKAPHAKVFAAEVAGAAPYSASHRAGHPVSINYEPSFVDGIGSPTVIARMFEAAQALGIGSVAADLEDVAAAVRTLAVRNRVIAEGAGATPVACALKPAEELAAAAETGPVVCVVSGGMIGMSTLLGLLKHLS
jgi:threonine dehydratase